MEIDNQNKPRLKKMKKHHIDGELIHAKFIEPYCDELEKYLDVCQVFESGHLPVTATTDVISVFNIIDKVVRDEMMF